MCGRVFVVCVSVCLCVWCVYVCCVWCVCVCVVYSPLFCSAQPFTPDTLLYPPSIEVSSASLGKIPSQFAILGAITSWTVCTYAHRAQADIPHTSQETVRSERSPRAGTHHKVDYILIAFVSPLSVWLQRPASIRCWAIGKSLHRAVPVSGGTEPPAGWANRQTDRQRALQPHHTAGHFLVLVSKPKNNFISLGSCDRASGAKCEEGRPTSCNN